jgi:hypothetical protein
MRAFSVHPVPSSGVLLLTLLGACNGSRTTMASGAGDASLTEPSSATDVSSTIDTQALATSETIPQSTPSSAADPAATSEPGVTRDADAPSSRTPERTASETSTNEFAPSSSEMPTSEEPSGASCDAELFIQRVGSRVVRARLSDGWLFQSEGESLDAATGNCLSPCTECVTLINGHDNYCSQACDHDDQCNSGETCFGCGEFKACVLRCDTDDDCLDVSGTCQAGICLWST